MIDDPSTVTPERGASEADRAAQQKHPPPQPPKTASPQERTKNPQDEGPKWPGGGKKGENEQA